ncbi:MAG TPA: ABC transporter substrate-binding protein [Xanthobacteraceae bacterium]|nr:ABC transporter substrate-binding protein [Xanthobacteraceae bacterium]
MNLRLRRTKLLAALALLAWGAGAHAAAAQSAPRHVVSFNLCTDQLVVALADPKQIAGLSPYAADPHVSVVAEQARNFRRLEWQAESVLPLAPDLVLVGPWDRPVTRKILNALGLRVVEVPLADDLDAVRAQIRSVAALLGHSDRGEDLIRRLDAARDRLAALRQPGFSTALVLERGGFTAGSASLVASILAQAGLRPPPGSPGENGGYLSLERLLMLDPDLLFLKDPPSAPHDQGALMFTHPALEALYPPQRRIALPTRYTLCGGPAAVAALDYMAGVMTRLAGRTLSGEADTGSP